MSRIVFWLTLFTIALPLFVIAFSFANFELSVWQHLYSTVLPSYLSNSLLLALGVGIGAGSIGTALAWSLTRFTFPGSRLLSWFSVLPLAMPAYIIAYTYTGLLDFTGPIQTGLREAFDWRYGDYWFVEIRSLGGAVAMLSLVLFPYVYLLARNAFVSLPANLKEACLSLGKSESQFFWHVALPIVRPAIVAGMMLAMMEALADFGTVAFFSVNTFTTGIFRTWFGIGSRDTALQLAGLLCVFVFVCIVLEQSSRRRVSTEKGVNFTAPKKLHGLKAWSLTFFCSLPVLLGFVVPVFQLLTWAFSRHSEWSFIEYWPLMYQSLYLACGGALATAVLALMISYIRRFNGNTIPSWTINLMSLGYALPGVVVAVGLLVPFGYLDRRINALTAEWFSYQPGLILSGSLAVLMVAYVVRFIAVAMQHTQNGLSSITYNMDHAAATLGIKRSQVLLKIHVPLMKNSVIAASLLVFVDIMKELPATLVLRPFNFNTLAVKAYEFAMDERLQQAALPSLSIVACGVLPVFILIKQIRNNESAYVSG